MTFEIPATIKFYLDSWLENAGIVGLCRIVGDDVTKENQEISIPITSLDNFSEKYFNFFASRQRYGRLTRYQDIIDFKNILARWQENDFNDFNEKKLTVLNEWYTNTLKYSVKSNSYKKVYKLIANDFDVIKALKPIDSLLKKLNRKNFLTKNLQEAHSVLMELTEELIKIIGYFDREDSKRYFPAKTLCYMVINNAWNGVSLLNPQTKIPDFYNDYQQYFVDPVKEYLAADHKKDKFVCSTCGRPIKSQKLSYSFLTGMGYDTARKTSNAWSFNNDQFICPICQLLYSCVSAGFNYNLSKQGVFVNYNHSVNELVKANDGIIQTIFTEMRQHGSVSPFRALTMSFANQLNQKQNYDLADVQVINYDNNHYHFTIIPPLAAKVISKSLKVSFGKDGGQNLLTVLYNTGIQNFRGINYYSIYDEVMRRLFNSTNLFSLIYEMETMLNAQSTNIKFNSLHIMALININTIFFKELTEQEGKEKMEVQKNDLSKMRGAGMNVLKYYSDNENEKKASTLAYKLLQAINSNNPEKFMAIILSVYASQSKIVPSNLINNIGQPDVFKQYALAFVAGLIGTVKKGDE
ncbi:type I-B CRISPR-associated protein Cas8b1/Cst1 [Limosilactobacillus reuteri]|uniref:type I-B CRISPR-associated protein Cas8b1/Cst1 n=1 Tax=Limosilactobacillus reuteri TaxID=1598 RepID=UPI00235FD1EA|nr:type I-B CRISPR-associated protein Cas8b1/Cst1 [Limosilactobacillus reuteri]MDD1406326.1 type I-B CRISPR-associated protein Cas8b1/Cst1 [Limosilactobacillus reuteri]